MKTEALLAVQNVSFSFSAKKPLLRDLSFDVQPGEVFAIIGHNGAGKTTLFHMILGYKFAQRGKITLSGQDVLRFQSRENLGYVPERTYLPVEQKFSSYLKYIGQLQGIDSSQLKNEIERVAREVGLDRVIDQPMKSFSKGMLQKAMLAQALMGNPRLMILDEPMSGLDPESRDQLRERIQKWKLEGKSIIFSSHALEDVEQLADRVLVLDQGVCTFLGTKEDWSRSKGGRA